MALDEEAYADAARSFAAALRRDPGNLTAKLGLAEARLGNGDFTGAEREFAELAAASDPMTRARALQGQGIALMRLGEDDRAHPLLVRAVEADPGLWRAWNALGQAHDAAGNRAEARQAYERALALRPREAALHNNLGVFWLHAGDPVTAEKYLATAIEFDPELAVVEANLRLALAFQGRYEEALAGVARERLPDTLNNVGYVALLRGDHARAESFFLRALEVSPSFYRPAWLNLQFLGTLEGR